MVCLRTVLAFFVAALLLVVGVRATALEAGSVPPPIALKAVDGTPISLGALRGKVVLVDFWASWCKPCRKELPALEKLYTKHKDQGFVVVAVNIDKERANMERFLRDSKLTFPIVHDADMRVVKRYRPATMPSSYLIGRDGKLSYEHKGFRAGDVDALRARIEKLLLVDR